MQASGEWAVFSQVSDSGCMGADSALRRFRLRVSGCAVSCVGMVVL